MDQRRFLLICFLFISFFGILEVNASELEMEPAIEEAGIPTKDHNYIDNKVLYGNDLWLAYQEENHFEIYYLQQESSRNDIHLVYAFDKSAIWSEKESPEIINVTANGQNIAFRLTQKDDYFSYIDQYDEKTARNLLYTLCFTPDFIKENAVKTSVEDKIKLDLYWLPDYPEEQYSSFSGEIYIRHGGVTTPEEEYESFTFTINILYLPNYYEPYITTQTYHTAMDEYTKYYLLANYSNDYIEIIFDDLGADEISLVSISSANENIIQIDFIEEDAEFDYYISNYRHGKTDNNKRFYAYTTTYGQGGGQIIVEYLLNGQPYTVTKDIYVIGKNILPALYSCSIVYFKDGVSYSISNIEKEKEDVYRSTLYYSAWLPDFYDTDLTFELVLNDFTQYNFYSEIESVWVNGEIIECHDIDSGLYNKVFTVPTPLLKAGEPQEDGRILSKVEINIYNRLNPEETITYDLIINVNQTSLADYVLTANTWGDERSIENVLAVGETKAVSIYILDAFQDFLEPLDYYHLFTITDLQIDHPDILQIVGELESPRPGTYLLPIKAISPGEAVLSFTVAGNGHKADIARTLYVDEDLDYWFIFGDPFWGYNLDSDDVLIQHRYVDFTYVPTDDYYEEYFICTIFGNYAEVIYPDCISSNNEIIEFVKKQGAEGYHCIPKKDGEAMVTVSFTYNEKEYQFSKKVKVALGL